MLAKTLEPADFYLSRHQEIAEAIMALGAVSAGVDTVTVFDWLGERYGKTHLDNIGGLAYLVELQSECPATTNAPRYAATVLDRSARRQLKRALHDSAETIDDLAIDIHDVLADVAKRVTRVDVPIVGRAAMDAGDFLNRDYSYRWMVPGLLERQDRLIFTGSEGAGKSTVLLQMGTQFSVGIHPWMRERFDPIVVLIIDLENSERQLWRRLNRMVDCCATYAQMALGQTAPIVFNPERLRVDASRNGIDLLTRVDRSWMTGLVAASKPDLLITGPVYKLFSGDRNDEGPALEVCAYLDQLRETYDVSILMEAHSPYATDQGHRRLLRPSGTPVWSRWPEFGYGIRRTETRGVFDWEAWRPPRDDGRTWPTRIMHGRNWPWVNFYEDAEPAF